MADTPQKTPPDQEMHWGIAYLREDIQDLRAGHVRLDAKVKAKAAELDAKIEAKAAEVHARIDRLEAKVDDLQRVIREQGTVLTQRMVMVTGLMTTVLLAAMKL